MEENNTEHGDEAAPQNPYMLFLLVIVFFITGLLGFLICHILKKKGYRCRTSPEEDYEIKEVTNIDQDSEFEILMVTLQKKKNYVFSVYSFYNSLDIIAALPEQRN